MLGVLEATHHLGEGWAVSGRLPIGSVRVEPPDGAPARFTGFGDLDLQLRYDLAALWGPKRYRPSLVASAGLALPSGTQRTVFATGLAPYLLAIGRGTWGLSGRLALTQPIHPRVALEAAVGVSSPVSASAQGLRMGADLGGSLGAFTRPASAWMIGARLDLLHRGRAWKSGEGTVLNSGGSWLAAELITAFRASERTSLFVGARTPIFAHVEGYQVSESFSVYGGVALVFSEKDEDEHDHGHDHDHGHGPSHDHRPGAAEAADAHARPGPETGDRAAPDDGPSSAPAAAPSAAPADVAELARGGESFALAAAGAPGKITVIDFWADWCEPCLVLGARLEALAARRPELAVRRVEVPDLDTPVAVEHLKGVEMLPVIWILDREGRVLRRLEGVGVEAALAAVEAALP